jgi:selenocysteine-specific elongation factor
MPVIATAGHVDHGKSALVLALTGTDPDRLPEEKERGLTIDLGFAELRLPSGKNVSIVDVPGHERFIKNMLAGVGGIDLALLVVAADEGVMPQTREHIAIIDLLGVERGVVALTKSDLVQDVSAAEIDVREVIAGTTLAGAPIIACSANTRTGLDQLLTAIEAQLASAPARRDVGRPRLAIDRAFTMAGFGTVVTGTLMDGVLRVGGEIEVLPGGLRARIRGLENHGRQVDVALPGRRTAINLAGIAVNELRRGMVVALPGTLRHTNALDVDVRTVPYLEKPLRHGLPVTFHTGAAECEARLSLLDTDSLAASESAWAQLRLDEPVVVLCGDRFIVRDPNGTLGGGVVVATDARRHRRHNPTTIASLEALTGGSSEDALLAAVERLQPVKLLDAASTAGLPEDKAAHLAERLVADANLVTVDGLFYTAAWFAALARRATVALTEYHREFPLRRGIPREELRSRLGVSPGVVNVIAKRGHLAVHGDVISQRSHVPALSPEQEHAVAEYLALLRATPFSPPTNSAPPAELVAYLLSRGDVVRVADGIVFARDIYTQMVERITERLRAEGPLTLAEVRDMFGTSRRYAQAMLEHLDAERITRRAADARVLR